MVCLLEQIVAAGKNSRHLHIWEKENGRWWLYRNNYSENN